MSADSSDLPVDPYESPNGSRLVPHEKFVARMRRNGWPFHAIVKRLAGECGVEISVSALHGFYRRQKIAKGKPGGGGKGGSREERDVIDPLDGLRPRGEKAKTGNRYVPPTGSLRTRSNGLLKDGGK